MIKRFFLSTIVPLIFCGKLVAQVADFSVPGAACINQTVLSQNKSTSATRYVWDYCQDGLTHLAASNDIATITSASIPVGCKLFYDQGQWFGFVCSRDGGDKLTQLNFGNSLTNTPTTINLSTQLAGFTGSSEVDFIQQGGNWYGFVVDFNSSSIVRMNFGSSLNNTPTSQNLGNLNGWNGIYGIEIINTGSAYYGLLTNYYSNIISVLSFGSSVLNTPAITSISDGLISSPVKIEVVQENLQWRALVTCLGNNKVVRLDFGNSFSNTPVVSSVADISGASGLSLKKDGSSIYGFVFGANGNLKRLDFGSSSLNTPSITDLAFPGGSTLIYGISVVKEWPNWKGIFIEVFSNKAHLLSFNDQCSDVSPITSTLTDVQLQYTSAGVKKIELAAYSSTGVIDTTSRSLTIQNLNAPNLSIITSNQCVNAPVNFSENLISGPAITTSLWDFGDGNSDNQASATNTYSSTGSYMVTLDVTSTNGCSNRITKTVAIYNPPTSTFTLPTNNPLCTNQQVTFTNTSTFDAGSSPSWEWFVNGTSVSMVKDLQQSFSTASPQTVKLKASIPGCFNESSQVVNSLLPGPQLGFTITGKCEDNDITFINTTTDPVTGYSWDFGDTQTSTATDVLHTYSNPGSYTVSLQGSSANGCQNTVTKNLIIYTQPQPSFSLSLPPFSCSGSASQFTDLTPNPTDSNIASWAWNFDDAGSNQNSSSLKNPTHVYATAANYNVSLTATTNFGCSGTLQKQVTVSQSPTASFTNTPACKNVPVIFTDTSTGNITSWYWQMDNTFYFVAQPKPTHIFTAAKTYPVSLTVTASNSCVSVITKNLVIPATLVPDFNFQKNCTNQNTVFTDITNAPSDPVVTSSWDVTTLGSKTGSPAIYTFPATGTYNVTLSVTAQSGCVYSITNPVSIVESPVAGFTATPDAGVPPLTVQFTNSSVQAKYYNWAFNDGSDNSTSTDPSPSHIFQGYGEYAVDLTASNDLGCVSTLTQIIKAVLPIKDISLVGFNIIENPDGSLKIIASLKNNGNVVLSNLSLVADVSGLAAVRENIEGPIAPNTIVNHTLAYEILKKNNLNFLCGEIELDGDVHPDDNKICSSITGDFFLYAPYPNPSSGTLHVDWIASEADALVATVYDAMGKLILDSSFQSSAGLNSAILNLVGLDKGIYLVSIKSTGINKVYKIVVVH